MKIQKFVNTIQFTLLHRAELSLTTLKYLLTEFEKCLTKSERARIKSQLDLISLTTSQQLSLNQSLDNAISKNLTSKLNEIKKGVNKK